MSEKIFKPMPGSFSGETKVVAVDCEMVETDRWGEGLARVSIVNYYGVILMDKFVIPECDQVTNYRTWVSGVRPENLKIENGALKFKDAKEQAHKLLKDKIVVGHSLKHDFQVMEINDNFIPKENIRDLTKFKKY